MMDNVPALFTIDQILTAKERAAKNPEDIKRKSFLKKIFGGNYGLVEKFNNWNPEADYCLCF